jgi:hypothetical protein
MAGTEKTFMLTQETRSELLLGDIGREARNLAPMGWGDATTAPGYFQDRIIEVRHAIVEKRAIPAESPAYVQAREIRMTLAQKAVRFVKNVFTSNADLHAQADRIARQINRDEAHARAEAERKFFETATPDELLRALEAKCDMREQPGSALSAQPGSTPCTACTPDQHSKAATYHRTLASKAASWQEGAAHHTAADCHAKAAEQFNADNSVAARSASEKCLDEYGDPEDQEDEY